MRLFLVCLQVLSPLFWFFLMVGRIGDGIVGQDELGPIIFESCLLIPILIGSVGVSFWRDAHSWGKPLIISSLVTRLALVIAAVAVAGLLGGTNGGAAMLGATFFTTIFAVGGLILVGMTPAPSRR